MESSSGTTRCTQYSIACHLAWIPKFRRRVFTTQVDAACKKLLRECCERQGLRLLEVETGEDHVHVLVSPPPRFSPSQIENLLKGHTSRYLREQFPHLNRLGGRGQLWTQACTAGAVSTEVIRRYVPECQGT
jgi:putative transposase